jgi:uncharacterized protein YjaG (DUF416 family)
MTVLEGKKILKNWVTWAHIIFTKILCYMGLTAFHLCCQVAKIHHPKIKEMLAARFAYGIEYLTVEEGRDTHTYRRASPSIFPSSVFSSVYYIQPKVLII